MDWLIWVTLSGKVLKQGYPLSYVEVEYSPEEARDILTSMPKHHRVTVDRDKNDVYYVRAEYMPDGD